MLGTGFDFPLLLFECRRHGISWAPFARWLFVDTFAVLRSVAVDNFGGCLKLQCLARASEVSEARAHRALEDVRALHGVMEVAAARMGLPLLSLLRPFAVGCDVVASLAHVSLLCES